MWVVFHSLYKLLAPKTPMRNSIGHPITFCDSIFKTKLQGVQTKFLC